tara:strand:+ start:494 stop:610 length:117 start_codon:yes stop_codon:yes gene_type:complete
MNPVTATKHLTVRDAASVVFGCKKREVLKLENGLLLEV